MGDLRKFPLLLRVLRRVWLQVLVLGVLLSAHVMIEFLPLHQQRPAYSKVISLIGVWIMAWIASRIVGIFREMPFVELKLAPNLRPLVFVSIRVAIYSLAFLIGLDSIGVSITPLLASLGVGSLAVGLALQDTLGNLFSGFYLYVDRPIAIGDWIRLESGVEGQVVAIGWRSTHLLVLQENMVVIPNSKLSSSVLINYNLPMVGTTLTVPLGVAYGTDLEKAERVLAESAVRTAEKFSAFMDGKIEPVVRFTKFGESSIDLTVSVRVRSFPDKNLIRHELIKEIQTGLAREGVEIPFPTRTIRQETNPGMI